MQLQGNLSIQQLFTNKLITRAAYNTCMREQLTSLAAISLYQKRFTNFLRIRNCGAATNKTLLSLCRQWSHTLTGQEVPLEEEPCLLTLADKWDTLAPWQQEEIENRYANLQSRLSRRAVNKLLTLCGGSAAAQALAAVLSTHLTHGQQHLMSPANASGAELASLVAEFTGFFEQPPTSAVSPASRLWLLQWRMSQLAPAQPGSPLGDFLKEEFSTLSTGRFPLLRFAHLFLQNCFYRRNRLAQAFLQSAAWYTANEANTLAAVALQVGYTEKGFRETLRKKKPGQTLLLRLGEAIELLRPFGLLVPAAFVLPGVVYQEVENREDEIFTPQFISSLTLLLNPAFTVVQLPSRTGGYPVYLSKEVGQRLNVAGFITSVGKILAERASEVRKVPVTELAAPFCTGMVTGDEERNVFLAASLILHHIFGLQVSEGFVYLPPTRSVSVAEMVYDLLQQQSKPCHAREITAMLAEQGVHVVDRHLWSYLAQKGRFIVMGRSTYGLKEWEAGGNKGGTIKQLIKKYLEEAGEPRHIRDISRWVMLHRNTSEHSIHRNMMSDPRGWFRFFGKGLYGLAGKSYGSAHVTSPHSP